MNRSVLNAVLAVGFVALAGGIELARRTPASGYEASIYGGTPPGVWAAFAVALAVAVGTTLACRGRGQTLGIALGATAVTAIVSLPAIRNYRFVGRGDSLTHLGWTRDVLGGVTLPHDLFYPALHGIASALSLTGGIAVERALLLAVILLFVPFVVFVPLVVRDVTGSAASVGFAAAASWLVLPINNIATHMGVHTNSNALFLVPAVLFAVVAFLRRRSDLETLPVGLSPYAALVVLTGLLLLLVHPQQMFNVVIVLGAISLAQFVARRRYDDHPMLDHSGTYALTGLLGLAFAAWVVSKSVFREAVGGLVYGLFAGDIGGDVEVAQREDSLAEIGGSLPELFAKLFLVAAVVGLAVGLFVLLTWLGRTQLDPDARSIVSYVVLALVPLTAVFAVYFVGTPTMAFRQVGFIYVLLTILGGIALAHGFGWLGNWITTPGAHAVAAAFLGVCLVLSLATVFSSPYIYTPGQHVPEHTMSSYESALERGDGETPYAGFGFAITRYAHGIQGVEPASATERRSGGDGLVAEDAFEDGEYADAYHTDDYYFTVTEWDEHREIGIYQELYHSQAALDGIETYEGANKVVSNDGVRMYDVAGD